MSYVVILAVFVFGGELLQKWKNNTGCVRRMWLVFYPEGCWACWAHM